MGGGTEQVFPEEKIPNVTTTESITTDSTTTETITTDSTTTETVTTESLAAVSENEENGATRAGTYNATTDGNGTIISQVEDSIGYVTITDKPANSNGSPWICTGITVNGIEMEIPAYGKTATSGIADSNGKNWGTDVSVDKYGVTSIKVRTDLNPQIHFVHEQVSIGKLRGLFRIKDISTDVENGHEIYWDGKEHRLFDVEYFVDVYNRSFSVDDLDKTLQGLYSISWNYSKNGSVSESYEKTYGFPTANDFSKYAKAIYDEIDIIKGKDFSESEIGTYEFDMLYQLNANPGMRFQFGADAYGSGKRLSTKIVKRPITIVTGSASKVEDGKPLSSDKIYTLSDIGLDLVEGHYISGDFNKSQTEVGKVENTLENLKIFDAEGNDVTNNYDITLQFGTLEVTADPHKTFFLTYEGQSDEFGSVECLIKGDVNMDGRLSMEDSKAIQEMKVGLRDEPIEGTDAFWCADTTGDGIISITDAIRIQRWLDSAQTEAQSIPVMVKDTPNDGYILEKINASVDSGFMENTNPKADKDAVGTTVYEGTILAKAQDHVIINVIHAQELEQPVNTEVKTDDHAVTTIVKTGDLEFTEYLILILFATIGIFGCTMVYKKKSE